MTPNRRLNLADEPLDSEHILACSRQPYLRVKDIVEGAGKGKWMAMLGGAAVLSCCRDPANYDIEAWWSTAAEKAKGPPDLYKFYCRVCEARVEAGEPDERGIVHDGCCKVAFCVGGSHPTDPSKTESRPMWEVR